MRAIEEMGLEGRKDVALPHQSPRIFNIFVQWLYTQTFTLSGAAGQDYCPSTTNWCDLYEMADYLQVDSLKTQIKDALPRYKYVFEKDLQPSTISYVYSNSAKGRPVRKVLVECFVEHISRGMDTANDANGYPCVWHS